MISPVSALKIQTASGKRKRKIMFVSVGRMTIAIHKLHKSAGIAVKSICKLSFALKTFHVETGSDWINHRLFPSIDIVGAVILFIEANKQILMMAIGGSTDCGSSSIVHRFRIHSPLIKTATEDIISSRVPKEQFKI